jgi:hypothetical protein
VTGGPPVPVPEDRLDTRRRTDDLIRQSQELVGELRHHTQELQELVEQLAERTKGPSRGP